MTERWVSECAECGSPLPARAVRLRHIISNSRYTFCPSCAKALKDDVVYEEADNA